MSTSQQTLEASLASVPPALRKRLIQRYLEAKTAYLEGNHDACGLRAGKFSEIVLRIVQHALTATHSKLGEKGLDFTSECNNLIRLPKSSGDESLRIVIPRVIAALYTIRNKRGIGHESAELDANEIDAALCARMCDWVLAELIRLLSGLPLEAAQALIDSLAQRELPVVWSVGGRHRVLQPDLQKRDQVLLLLYSRPSGTMFTEDLVADVEAPRLDLFRSRTLRTLHAKRMVEYNQDEELVHISPLGSKHVEDKLLVQQID